MKFPKILCALDFTNMDASILAQLKYLIQPLGIEEAYFMHIIKILAMPRVSTSGTSRKFQPDYALDERLAALLQKQIAGHNLPLADHKIHCEVHEGRPVYQLVCWAEHHRVDLVIMGNKEVNEGSGITSRRMAHQLKSSILFLPNKPIKNIESIVVPMDYSENSNKALMGAVHLQNKIGGVKIKALHVLEKAHPNLYPAGLHTGEDIESIKEKNIIEFQKMLQRKGIEETQVDFEQVEQTENSVAKTLHAYFELSPCDLVIMGSVGHSRLEDQVYGSNTEIFVESYLASPILIIR